MGNGADGRHADAAAHAHRASRDTHADHQRLGRMGLHANVVLRLHQGVRMDRRGRRAAEHGDIHARCHANRAETGASRQCDMMKIIARTDQD
ncbi:MAG: hypothetical protein MZV64_15835 [Ignavibacteriales bacterium]|nr:hypothetical protein [Ignavibacteriales bacterium]